MWHVTTHESIHLGWQSVWEMFTCKSAHTKKSAWLQSVPHSLLNRVEIQCAWQRQANTSEMFCWRCVVWPEQGDGLCSLSAYVKHTAQVKLCRENFQQRRAYRWRWCGARLADKLGKNCVKIFQQCARSRRSDRQFHSGNKMWRGKDILYGKKAEQVIKYKKRGFHGNVQRS